MNEGRFTFTDKNGAAWDVTLTLSGARRVDNSDFSEIHEGEVSLLRPDKRLVTALTTDVSRIAAVVWSLVKPAADAKQISEDQFIDALDGHSIAAMKEAFWGALMDFFQDRGTAL